MKSSDKKNTTSKNTTITNSLAHSKQQVDKLINQYDKLD